MSFATAHATAAATSLTSSSGATATLPAIAGQTIYLQKAFLENGPSLVTLANDATISGLSGGTLSLPFSQVLNQGTQFEMDLTTPNTIGVPASAPNTAISLSIPALLGGAETTLVLLGVYF